MRKLTWAGIGMGVAVAVMAGIWVFWVSLEGFNDLFVSVAPPK